jgi:predicted transcriptional regulator
MDGEITRTELMKRLGLSDRKYFRKEYLQKALNANLIELTIPDKPSSKHQKYRLTPKGKKLQEQLKLKTKN